MRRSIGSFRHGQKFAVLFQMADSGSIGDALLGCDQRQLTRSVTRKRSDSYPPTNGHERRPCPILKAAWRLSAEADIVVDASE